jgi:hypothetical protein
VALGQSRPPETEAPRKKERTHGRTRTAEAEKGKARPHPAERTTGATEQLGFKLAGQRARLDGSLARNFRIWDSIRVPVNMSI